MLCLFALLLYFAVCREASRCIQGILAGYGPAEKLGLDELFVDVTKVLLLMSYAVKFFWNKVVTLFYFALGSTSMVFYC